MIEKLKIIAAVVGCMFGICALAVLGFWLLCETDKNYDCYRDVIMCCLNENSHFKRDTWFSAEATLMGAVISAVPGLFCGVFALIQTKKLHMLEARYHRPVLELDEAELRFIRIRQDEKEDVLNNRVSDRKQYANILDAFNNGLPWYIELSISFSLKNEIAVKELYLQYVEFIFPNTSYKLELQDKNGRKKDHRLWDCERIMKNNQMVYFVSHSLCLSECCQNEDEFWDGIHEFAFYSDNQNLNFKYMSVFAYFNAKYEYGEKTEKIILKLDFNAEQADQSKIITTNKSSNGYFTFDVKR